MDITINIKGLDQLSEAVALLGSAIAQHNGMDNTKKALEEIPKSEPVKEEVSPNYTMEDIRAKVASLNRVELRDDLREIIHRYADNVSSIDKSDYDNVMADLEALA